MLKIDRKISERFIININCVPNLSYFPAFRNGVLQAAMFLVVKYLGFCHSLVDMCASPHAGVCRNERAHPAERSTETDKRMAKTKILLKAPTLSAATISWFATPKCPTARTGSHLIALFSQQYFLALHISSSLAK